MANQRGPCLLSAHPLGPDGWPWQVRVGLRSDWLNGSSTAPKGAQALAAAISRGGVVRPKARIMLIECPLPYNTNPTPQNFRSPVSNFSHRKFANILGKIIVFGPSALFPALNPNLHRFAAVSGFSYPPKWPRKPSSPPSRLSRPECRDKRCSKLSMIIWK